MESFNPRPPFRAGATPDLSQYTQCLPVSILARPFERALRCWWERDTRSGNVSILARPFERALLQRELTEVKKSMFQSSPALSSGRYGTTQMVTDIDYQFQSSPALSSGRYP